jgi:carbonic anhydrase
MRALMMAVFLALGVLSGCTTLGEAERAPTAGHPPAPEGVHEEDAAHALDSLVEGNERFVSGHPHLHDFGIERRGLVTGQHPRAIVLSCSDSRLPPEFVFDQTLGELFVVRSAGNVADTVSLASIEYAAEHLHTHLLVILGHEHCGAVTAAAEGEKMPTRNLQSLMEELSPSLAPLKGRLSGEALIHQGVEANVVATAEKVLDRSALLDELVKEGKLQVVEGVYDLESGRVRRLAEAEHALALHHHH